jgi:glucose-6-phosphate-specific signal transduction histidine kinase
MEVRATGYLKLLRNSINDKLGLKTGQLNIVQEITFMDQRAKRNFTWRFRTPRKYVGNHPAYLAP